MAIKTVDISNAGVVESIRANMAVATATAKGLLSNSEAKQGPFPVNLAHHHLYKIADATNTWDQNVCVLYLSNYANANMYFINITNTEDKDTVVAKYINIAGYQRFQLYRKEKEYYLVLNTLRDSYNGFAYISGGFTDMGRFETLDDSYTEVAITELSA